MKNTFFMHHIRSEDIYSKILNESSIILDTNALLNLYRYNNGNRKKFFEILDKVKNRLVITHHIGEEFYKNRDGIVYTVENFKIGIQNYLNKDIESIKRILSNCSGKGDKNDNYLSLLKHESCLKDNLINILSKCQKDIEKELNKEQKNSNTFLQGKDEVLEKITSLYDGKVVEKLTQEKLKKIYQEGEERYKDHIPPGYEDKDKSAGKRKDVKQYGDLVIWHEMMNYSEKKQKNVLFISDDRKEDWVYKFKGKDLGPRRELIEEFHKKTKHYFYSLTVRQFIEEISKQYSIDKIEELEKESILLEKIREENKEITFKEYYEEIEAYEDRQNEEYETFCKILDERYDKECDMFIPKNKKYDSEDRDRFIKNLDEKYSEEHNSFLEKLNSKYSKFVKELHSASSDNMSLF